MVATEIFPLDDWLSRLVRDRLEEVTIQHHEYSEVDFGVTGRLLLALRNRAVPVIAAALASDDVMHYGETILGRTGVTEQAKAQEARVRKGSERVVLPLRLRDYGLLLLTALRREPPGFGPTTPYAERDRLYYRIWQSL